MNNYVKRIAILIVFFAGTSVISGQSNSGWGLRGGLNYGSSGDLVSSFDEIVNNPESNLGWHLGVYGKMGDRVYLRPELLFTHLNSKYDDNKFRMQKIDLPVLVGLRIIGPLHAFVGPAFQYVIDTDLKGFELGDLENNFSVGFNIGVGVNLGNLGIDLRYERGFNKNEVDVLGSVIDIESFQSVIGTIDTRPQQLILAVSFKMN